MSLDGYGGIFYRNVQASGVIPQISVILGPCAGGAVYSPAMTDFIFMVRSKSHMFITGPDVVKTVTGEEVSLEDLGGATSHSTKSGVATFVAADEHDVLDDVKAPAVVPAVQQPRAAPGLQVRRRSRPGLPGARHAAARQPQRPLRHEGRDRRGGRRRRLPRVPRSLGPQYRVRLRPVDGRSVGVVGNQPMVLAGVLDIESAEKAARFVRTCDAFNIPLVTFVDVPGFLPGVDQEHGGIIRHGAKLLYAYCEAAVPASR